MHVEEPGQAELLPEGADVGDGVRSGAASVTHALEPAADGLLGLAVACRSARACRLSHDFLPLASAISTLARPSTKYIASGTTVRPFSFTRRSILSISTRLSSSLRLRRAEWLVQVPCAYSGMWTPCSQASSPSMSTNPSTSEARPSRSDFTSVPISTRPAS